MSEETSRECRLLLLPDGRLLVRNVTPELSALLAGLLPDDSDLARRTTLAESNRHLTITPSHP